MREALASARPDIWGKQKPWKQMSKEEKKAHVKETAEWIRNEMKKDRDKFFSKLRFLLSFARKHYGDDYVNSTLVPMTLRHFNIPLDKTKSLPLHNL